MTRALLIPLVLLGACPAPPRPVDPRSGAGDDALGESSPCVVAAGNKAAAWRAAAVPDAENEVRYQAELARCAGATDDGTARLIGAINVDLFRISRLMVVGTFTPAQYLARVRDRADKARRAQRDPNWTAQYLNGDADGDLVPDKLDSCPGTPDLQPTDATGCPIQPSPSNPDPPAPDLQQVRAVLDHMNLIADPNCAGAVVPATPATVKVGYGDLAANLAVRASGNQPHDCLVLYEIDVRMRNPGWETTGQLGPRYPHFVMRDTEAAAGPFPAGVLRWKLSTSDTKDLGGRALFASYLAQYAEVLWRVRAINGDGLKSGWSDWQSVSGPTTGSSSGPFTIP